MKVRDEEYLEMRNQVESMNKDMEFMRDAYKKERVEKQALQATKYK